MASLPTAYQAIHGLSQMKTDIVVRKTFVDGPGVVTWCNLHMRIAPPVPWDGRPTCASGDRGRLTPQDRWLRDTRVQDPHPDARRSSKSEVSIEVASDGQADFWAHVVRHGRGYGWPRISIRVTPRWQELKARGLEVVDGQLVLELVEDGPEPLVRSARAEGGYGGGRPMLARVTRDGHLSWQEPLPDPRF